ncbi:MAG: hypothetical protein GC179_10920 [Anaerolineaceae bacterium]|nr:hypothetical protein [Anaerolineaceae bacterium]
MIIERANIIHMGHRRSFIMASVLITMLFLLWGVPLVAQDASSTAHVWEVFLRRGVAGAPDNLTFVDVITGDQTPIPITGERYTLVGNAVMYIDRVANRVMMVYPDGKIGEHPFIQPGTETRRVDWQLSADGKKIAWTLTEGSPTALTTLTNVANVDGTDVHEVLADGPRNAIRALPVAFSPDYTILYMDFQPDGFADFTPMPQYAGLIGVDIATGKWDYLPDEPSCFCGAGFGNGVLLRLRVSQDLSGFDVHVYNLAGKIEQTIPAKPLRGYTQSGDVVISPDGQRAVYALAQVQNFGRADQSVRTVFMLIDMQLKTQIALTEPITTFVEPHSWTEDNSALLLTSRQQDGTWKINLSDGKLARVADATYLGTVR